MKSHENDFVESMSCPAPLREYPKVLLAHGSGGKLTHQLIQEMFLPSFNNPLLASLHDGAQIGIGNSRIAFSTDSYVVDPIFFPGGDIGELAVNGTINDLAMCGAQPICLSAALIIEEGFSMEELARVVASMKRAAERAGTIVATGDTKVVERGKGDKLFITTTGLGIIHERMNIAPSNATAGDRIILSGKIAAHGIAIMSVREGLEFESKILSDTAPLNGLVALMGEDAAHVHVLRDPTRGGVASVLNEIAQSSHVGISILEKAIPVAPEVNMACELLGFDPLYVANEGKLLAFVAPEKTDHILKRIQEHPLGRDAAVIGEVTQNHLGLVVMKTLVGGTRIIDMLSGEQLPRIC